MRADGCDNHTGNTRVNHTGSCCQGVGSATCGCGNYDTCRKGGGGGGGRKEKRRDKSGEKERKMWEAEMETTNISVYMVILFMYNVYHTHTLLTKYDYISTEKKCVPNSEMHLTARCIRYVLYLELHSDCMQTSA